MSAPTLPPADIEISTNTKTRPDGLGENRVINAKVSRDGSKTKEFEGEGSNYPEATKKLLEHVFSDPTSAEFISPKKKE